DVKATNIILQGLPPEERECKLYDEFDKFAYKKGESLLNTKFLNTLPPEWSKFVTYVKLVRDSHIKNVDQLHAYLGKHQFHANEVRLMHEHNSDPFASVANHQMTQSPYQTHQQSYQHTQFQPQVSPFQSSQYGLPLQSSQYGSRAQSSTPLSITYPSNDFQSSVHHNVYNPSSSIPQVEYAPSVHQQSDFSQPDSSLIVPVLQKGDDPIDPINHMMSFFTAVATSRRRTHVKAMHKTKEEKDEAWFKDKGESLREFYLRFLLLLDDMNIYNMKLKQFQVNTKFLNTLSPEWSKFVTDVKLVRDLHNINQLHAYLGQHEFYANDIRLIHERDDLIDVINHMMSFLTVVVTSRYPPTNNQLRNSSNPRQQATINNERETVQPIQGRQNSLAAGTSRPYTAGPSGNNSGKQRTVFCYNCKG
nr:hypothetical protein [Tanacetum cinerariifolium]